MRKSGLVGVVLAMLLVGGAVFASLASGTEFLLAEWLAAGAKITTAQASDAEGEVELVSLNGGGLGIKATVLCSGIVDGTIGPISDGTITELLSLAGTAISKTPLTGTALTCTNDGNCTEPLVWAIEFPWKTELELTIVESETFFVDLVSPAGFYTECLVLGITLSESCSFPQWAKKIINAVGGVVTEIISDEILALIGIKLGNCTLGGSETAEVTGSSTGLLTSGTALTASSE